MKNICIGEIIVATTLVIPLIVVIVLYLLK